jgi:hypothetical protein
MSYTITTGTNTLPQNTWVSTNTNSTINWNSPTYTIGPIDDAKNTLQVKGDANFEGDVKIQGKSLVETLDRIEERLAILKPNEELEKKWEKLRDLRKEYMELEAELKEKEKIWDILKK